MTLGWLVLGALVGGVHGWTQHQTVARLRPEVIVRGVALVVLGAVVRWLLTAGLLLLAVLQSIEASLLALAGMTVVRWTLVLWWNWGRRGADGPVVRG
jgi:hypothetical protein